ncbi:hemolysin family protein [Flexibacterium corallicola]|uniref:hemolysin family protein n=1 Tax=Flexibacterium corallicola TaxID=3037259 RepID=UPI00286F381E|nr:hemolysin family protein [Pseudovibrio sp. M1P-2-3]
MTGANAPVTNEIVESKAQPDETGDPEGREPGLWTRLKKFLNPFRSLRRSSSDALRADLEDELARTDNDADAAFSASEKELLANILQLRELRVEDVMIPRADIEAVEDCAPIGHVMARFQASGHSRMPVFHDNLDDPRGMIHIKDLMAYFAEHATSGAELLPLKTEEQAADTKQPEEDTEAVLDLSQVDLNTPLARTGLIRELHFVPPSMSSADLMKKMQVTRVQMALVIDEYGGTDGLVSLEDIVETVVGDIEDEHDKDEEALIKSVSEGVWVVDPRVDLEDIQKELGANFRLGEVTEDVDTIGGMLFALLDRVPVRGELISEKSLPGYEFEVLDADPRRIKMLKIYKRRIEQRASTARLKHRRLDAAAE